MNKLSVNDYFNWRYGNVNWSQYGPDDGLNVFEKDGYDCIETFVNEYSEYLQFEGSLGEWKKKRNINLKSFY